MIFLYELDNGVLFNPCSLIQDKDTKKIFVVIGYGFEKNYFSPITYISFLTEFYIGKDTVYNSHFVIDGYFESIKESLLSKPLVVYKFYSDLNSFISLNQELYEIKGNLFTEKEIRNWYMRSKMVGLKEEIFLTRDELQKEVDRLNHEEKYKKDKELEEKLKNVVYVSEKELEIGTIYKYPVSDKIAIYLGKDKDGKYTMLPISTSFYNRLTNVEKNYIALYQNVYNILVKSLGREKKTVAVPKVEVYSDLRLGSSIFLSTNMKLVFLKYDIKI